MFIRMTNYFYKLKCYLQDTVYDCVCYAWLTKLSMMVLDGRMFYSTSATTIRQLL
jgi:hypothetical protein